MMKKFSKRILTMLLSVAMVFGLSGMTVFAAEADDAAAQDTAAAVSADEGGAVTLAAEYEPDYGWYAGPDQGTYSIGTANELAALSEIVNGTSAAADQYSFEGQTIILTGNINMNEADPATVTYNDPADPDYPGTADITVTPGENTCAFTPIGNMRFNDDGSVVDGTYSFLGTFDGAGNTISNLYVSGDDGYLGLFGVVGGTEAGDNAGIIKNLTVEGAVECTGGDTNDQMDYVGGVCAKLNAGARIQNVTNKALVDAPYTDNVGGIVGFAGTPVDLGYTDNPSVDNTFVYSCENTVPVLGYYKVAGIVGENAATVKYCCNSGWILARRSSGRVLGIGGIVGRNGNNNTPVEESVIAYCYNTGMISNEGRNDNSADNTIQAYAGITGAAMGSTGHNEVYNCYNIGAIPKGYQEYNSIVSNVEGAAGVAVRDNYSPSDSAIINNYSTMVQETGIQIPSADFLVQTNNVGDILTNLGGYFVPDTDNINNGYPILFWQDEQEEPEVTELEIATPPDKTTYDGEVFDPEGMVVIAHYSNGQVGQIQCAYATYNDDDLTLHDGYTYPKGELTSDKKTVEITFGTANAKVSINGGEVTTLTDLDITPPEKTVYHPGDTFDPTGMTFTAVYSDGTTKILEQSDVTFDPSLDTPLTEGQNSVTISYTEDDVTVDAEQAISVVGEIGDLTVTANGETYSLSQEQLEDAATQRTLHKGAGGEEVTADFANIAELLDKELSITEYDVLDITSTDGITTRIPGDAYASFDNAYLYVDQDDDGTEYYRLAGDNIEATYWLKYVTQIDAIGHQWGEVSWTWAKDFSSVEASRTCSLCGKKETVEVKPSYEETTAPTERTAGVDTYTATATFEDGTEVTDTKDRFIGATGSIAVDYTKIDGTTSGELPYTTLNEEIEQTDPFAIHYISHATENTLIMPFVSIASALGIDEPFCSFYAIAREQDGFDGFSAELPTDAYLYQCDLEATNPLIYRTAVDGGVGNQFVNNVTYIEVRYVHNWGDPTWTWADDHSSATVTDTCKVSVCGKEETIHTTDITSETTPATPTEEGKTVYTATATFSDGTVVTGTDTVIIPITPVDKTALQKEVDEDKELNEDDYTADSWAPFATALKDAQDVLDDPDAAQDAVDAALKTLQDAKAGLVEVAVDKTKLEEEIESTEDLIESDYTEDSWAAFELILTAAKAVDADPDATQSDVDEAVEALQDAIDALEAVPADKTELEEEIESTDDLVESDYTADSWAALEEALAAAEAANADPNALQSEVDEAVEALQDAIDALEAVPADKTELEEEIESTDDLVESDYTADSWAALEEALAAAEAANADPNALQSEVEAAAEALKTAIDNLEPVGPEVKNGLLKDSDGVWRLYKDNVFQRDYNGFAENENGKWYVERGIVTFTKTDILKDQNGAIGNAGDWYYVIDSKVREDFTGLSNFSNQYGWWYIEAGKVDFTRNSVDKNKNGWWYVVGGKVQFGFTGLANYKNQYGWWYIEGGKVNFNHNGVEKNKNGWYYVVGSKVQFDFTGLAHYRNDHGWWYIEGGKVNFNHTGVEKNQNGWWYVKDSKVDFSYSGTASNRYGTWNIVNGKVWFS